LRTAKSGSRAVFSRDLSAPEPIPEAGIARAVEIMRRGTLHRYGESHGGIDEVSAFEQEFADYMGSRYALGLNSCGCALFVALKSIGLRPGDPVLLNAFTLAPVPGAISHAGGRHVFVDIRENLTIDLDDLRAKASRSGARVLLLSHMRGHIADMEAVFEVCDRLGVTIIEDCAHTVGARWNGRLSGSFGKVSCFSSQAFKHLNSGEGGILVTNDDDVAARAILYSGSYMFFGQHRARPPLDTFEKYRLEIPNCSMRMSTLVAALLRPQLQELDARCQRWTQAYLRLAGQFAKVPGIRVPERDPREQFVGSSLQFVVQGLEASQISRLMDVCDAHGVHVKWFGRAEPKGFTSRYGTWRYVGDEVVLPKTDGILDSLCDMRVPADLSDEDCRTMADVVRQGIEEVAGPV
jgi:dTDP-4-amino-4,6-dideoxygalactose transaminase